MTNENDSGRKEKRRLMKIINNYHSQQEIINISQKEWVFSIPWTVTPFGKPSSFIIKFRKPINFEDFLRILRSVEDQFESAFLD